MLSAVVLYRQFAVVTFPFRRHNTLQLADIEVNFSEQQWESFDGNGAIEVVHWWLKEQASNFFQDDYILLYEATRYVVQEYSISLGSAKVLALDLDDQDLKLILFRALPDQ